MFNVNILYILTDNDFIEYYLKEMKFNEVNNVSSYEFLDSIVSQNLCDVNTRLLLKQSKYDSSYDDNLEDILVNDYQVDKVVHRLKSAEEAI